MSRASWPILRRNIRALVAAAGAAALLAACASETHDRTNRDEAGAKAASPAHRTTPTPQKQYEWPADPAAVNPCALVKQADVQSLLGSSPDKASRFQKDVSGYGHVNHCDFRHGDDLVEVAVDQDTAHTPTSSEFQSLYEPRTTAAGDRALKVESLGPPTGAMLTANDTLNLETVVYTEDSWLLTVQVVRHSLPNTSDLLPQARKLLGTALARYSKTP
ncbi:hypothetical protein [Streptomyces siamensis]|uniref:DUF3558 domain-containing protein n=1 Tax=Streptomyces siamensis TaxID=1274986 RepID=A0ABP9JHU9_9ACTN